MSIETEISRIIQARNNFRNKAVELGIAENTAKIDVLATAFGDIENRGSVSATIREGDTYTIPKGYHSGSGTVTGVAGGGNYTLQSKSVTPTKTQHNITPDSGYYGLSDVTVAPIPENYQDVSSVTAVASDVLATKVFVDTKGTPTAGTMANNGTVTKTLNATTKSYTIPVGYHNGSGTVNIVTEEKTVTPTKSSKSITPTTGKVLSKVTVNPIPSQYQDVSGVTATAENVLTGSVFVNTEGEEVIGTMVNNGAIKVSISGLTETSYTIPKGYHNGIGTVNLSSDIENALSEI